MSYSVNSINKTSITLTRGDTLKVRVAIKNVDGTPYVPKDTDQIRFAMKKTYDDSQPLITRIIPNDTLILQLDPVDTKSLPFGRYVYDIQLTNAIGEIDTFITKATIRLTEEVD